MPTFMNDSWQAQIPDHLMALLSSGQGLFETILYDKNILWFWELHWQRLARSLHFFKIAEPSFDLKKYLLECINKIQPEQPTRIKLIYTFSFEDPSSRMEKENIIVQISPEKIDASSQSGLQLLTQPSPYVSKSPLIRHKTLGYADLFYGRNQAIKAGFDDVLYYNSNGLITETSYSNIFAVKGETLFTPNITTGILPGTVRSLLLENLGATEIDIHLNGLAEFDYFFVSSSVKELRLVGQIDNFEFKINSNSFNKIRKKWELIKSEYRKRNRNSRG